MFPSFLKVLLKGLIYSVVSAHSLDSAVWSAEVFNAHENPVSLCALGVIAKKLLPKPRFWRLTRVLFFGILWFELLCVVLWSTWNEFCTNCEAGVQLHSPACGCQLPSTICWKTVVFSFSCFGTPVENQLTLNVRVPELFFFSFSFLKISRLLILFHWSLFYPVPLACGFDYCTFEGNFELGRVSPPNLFFKRIYWFCSSFY